MIFFHSTVLQIFFIHAYCMGLITYIVRNMEYTFGSYLQHVGVNWYDGICIQRSCFVLPNCNMIMTILHTSQQVQRIKRSYFGLGKNTSYRAPVEKLWNICCKWKDCLYPAFLKTQQKHVAMATTLDNGASMVTSDYSVSCTEFLHFARYKFQKVILF